MYYIVTLCLYFNTFWENIQSFFHYYRNISFGHIFWEELLLDFVSHMCFNKNAIVKKISLRKAENYE